jgi:hypothetical protein
MWDGECLDNNFEKYVVCFEHYSIIIYSLTLGWKQMFSLANF